MTLVLTLAAAASATTYTITDLGVIAGNTGNESEAMGVNDSGVVVGDVKITSKSAGYRAAYYTTAGGWHDIGSAIDSAGETFATGINDSGQIAMWNRTNLPVDSYMYTISSGTYVNLGTQPGVANGANPRVGSDSYFPGQYRNPGPVNSSGEVVGTYAGTAGNGAAAFIWNGSSTVAMVTPGTGNGSVYPCGINDAGVVVAPIRPAPARATPASIIAAAP
jgi:uncharacterized membrane protein